MRKITIITLLLFTTSFSLHSQNLKTITIKECEVVEIQLSKCANHYTAKYDYASIVVNTNLNITFDILNAKCNLGWIFREQEKNRYILCVEPMNELYSEYIVEISGKDIYTKTFTIKNLKPTDKRFYCITEVAETVSNVKPTTDKSPAQEQKIKEVIPPVSNEKPTIEEQKTKEAVSIPETVSSTTSVLINGVRWATCNVNTPGTFTSKPSEIGMFYQWNSKVGWSVTDPLVNDKGKTTSWKITHSGTIWEAANNPCPTGWRVPNYNEIESLINSGSIWGKLDGVEGRFFGKEARVFLPFTGHRSNYNGKLYNVKKGTYWSSEAYYDNEYAWNMVFGDIHVGIVEDNKCSYGFSVRCVKE